MLYEKPNESSLWKNKLDDLGHLQEEGVPDKTLAWEKLHSRLLQKPYHKTTRWYWTAAACLLLSIGIPWLTVHDKENTPVKSARQPVPGSSTIPQAPSTEKLITPSHALTDNIRPVTMKAKTRQPFLHGNKYVESNAIDSNKASLSTAIIPEENSTSVHPDTNAFATAVPPKKKLRVVHINELDRPSEPMPIARSHALPAFESKSLYDDAFSVLSVSNNSSDNILKIKLSPSN